MPKKRTTAKKSAASENGEKIEAVQPVANTEVPFPAKARKKASKPAAKKTAAPRQAKTAKRSNAKRNAEPSADQIQLRAYFISEHRQRLGVPGDHHSDWLEARRQLLLEAGQN